MLEVKGDFCKQVRGILQQAGREHDYIEIGSTPAYCYNPLHNDLDPYAVAYAIATLLNNLFGKSKEPFWQQAYTDLLKFVILLRRISDGYTTLADVYHYILEPSKIELNISKLTDALKNPPEVIIVSAHDYRATLRATALDAVVCRERGGVRPSVRGGAGHVPRSQECAVSRRQDQQQRVADQTPPVAGDSIAGTSTAGVASTPAFARRSPKASSCSCRCSTTTRRCTGPSARRGQAYAGDVEAWRAPAASAARRTARNRHRSRSELPGGHEPWPGTGARRDAEARFPARGPETHSRRSRRRRIARWRDLVFICDEYHAFATVGETDPTGDERTFALSRQARLIPIVATQSVSSLRSALPGDESWRTLMQCFRTKLFLATSDEFTAKAAAELCGRRDRLKAHYTLAESGQGAHVSLLTGRAVATKQSLSASKSYAPHHEYIFPPRVFTELQNGQAIAIPYDGFNPLPPQFCYLKPHYLDANTSYFDHVERGAL